ncbi:hypothetical protein OAO01_06490 [Oligoflexia bacterium]|nr:hypothetical protein [Oligoflexia bacterium]
MELQQTSDDVSPLLEELARQVLARGMEVAAIFFLELYKPLTSLFHTASVISVPLLVPLFGAKRSQDVLRILESRANVEQLIQLLEKQR